MCPSKLQQQQQQQQQERSNGILAGMPPGMEQLLAQLSPEDLQKVMSGAAGSEILQLQQLQQLQQQLHIQQQLKQQQQQQALQVLQQQAQLVASQVRSNPAVAAS